MGFLAPLLPAGFAALGSTAAGAGAASLGGAAATTAATGALSAVPAAATAGITAAAAPGFVAGLTPTAAGLAGAGGLSAGAAANSAMFAALKPAAGLLALNGGGASTTAAASPGYVAGLTPTQGILGGAAKFGAGSGLKGLLIGTSKALAPSLLSGGLSALTMGKPPKPVSPAKPPAPAGRGASSFFGSGEGSANGTFLTGSNYAPQVAGGKKTLLGA